MSKIKPNEQCPCGSGRKYKKCCMGKDLDAASTASATSSTAPVAKAGRSSAANVSPTKVEESEKSKQWSRFNEASSYQEKVAIFHHCLSDKALLDDEQAYEMLDTLEYELEDQSPEQVFVLWGELCQALEDKRPDLFAISEGYYLHTRLTQARAAERYDDYADLMRRFAPKAGSFVETFVMESEFLNYYGDPGLLLEVGALVWKSYLENDLIDSQEGDNLAASLFCCEAFRVIEAGAELDLLSPEFCEATTAYRESVNLEFLTEGFLYLTGKTTRTWTPEDFRFQAAPTHDDFDDDDKEGEVWFDPARRSLYLLGMEFVGHVYREEGVPLAKADLARATILHYLRLRFEGRLRDTSGTTRSSSGSRDKGKKAGQRAKVNKHSLTPDAVTLERFLITDESLLYSEEGPYKAFACYELLPSWLRFLAARGLCADNLPAILPKEWTSITSEIRRFARKHHQYLFLENIDG